MNVMDDGISRWRRVADGLRAAIAEGSYGDRLPPETELAKEFGVNRHTVRRAISALSDEGVLRAERGRGTFINEAQSRITYPIGTRARFSENMMRQSLESAGRLINSERVAADRTQAALLEVKLGAPLYKMEKMTVVEGLPVSRSTAYFSAERFPGIIAAYAETGSVTRALKQLGLDDYRRRETRLTAERISPSDAEFLHCAPDSLVLVSNAIDVDLDDVPIQAIRTRFLADRIELVFKP